MAESSELDINDLSPQQRANLSANLNRMRLNESQAILQTPYSGGQPYTFEKPDSFGGTLKNIGKNLLRPATERLGLTPSIEGRLANMRYDDMRRDIAGEAAERSRDQILRESLKSQGVKESTVAGLYGKGLQDFSTSYQSTIKTRPDGSTYTENPLNYAQKTLTTPTTNQSEYLFSTSQLIKANEGLPSDERAPLPNFDNWMAQKNLRESNPAAVKAFEYLKTVDPSIEGMTAEDQAALFMKVLRQGRDVDYEYLAADARTRGASGGINLTDGEKERDKVFAKGIADYEQFGGIAQHRRNSKELNGIIKLLMKEDDDASSISGKIISGTPDLVRTPKSLDVQNQVERIITQDLRATLGSQFTAEEGERFVGYAYNIMLPPSINAKRLARLRNAAEQSAEEKNARINYFNKEGTLKAYKGRDWFKEDVYDAVFELDDYKFMSDGQILERLQTATEDDTFIDAEFEVLLDVVRSRGIE
mgnify:FL=1